MASDRINPGHLNRMITIQYDGGSKTSFGNVKSNWLAWANEIPAMQEKLTKPTEGDKQGLLISAQYVVWIIHFLEMEIEGHEIPDTKMRLFDEEYPKRIYNIEAVEEVGFKAGWRMYTKLQNA